MKPSLISIAIVTSLSCAAFAAEASARAPQFDANHVRLTQSNAFGATPSNPPHLAFEATPSNPPHLA